MYLIKAIIRSDAFGERKNAAPIQFYGSSSLPMGKRP
jgi:hypothetical protein